MIFKGIAYLDQLIFSSKKNVLIALVIWGFVLNGLCLWSQEFIRHTEADRTLIGWEIYENGNFLVPTLLGSQILTKPPLYYWLSATSIFLFGTGSEMVARVPSLVVSVLFLIGQFYCWFLVSGKLRLSALASFALSTSVHFFILSSLAEIDMLFGFMSSMAIASLFFVLVDGNKRSIIFFSIFLFLAFLTKGPPVYFFTGGACFTFILLEWFLNRNEKSWKEYVRPITLAAISVFISFALIALWLIPLAYVVGWDALSDRFKEEVFSRVVSYSERERGILFYVSSLLISSIPWSFFLIIGLGSMLLNKEKLNKSWIESASPLCADERIRTFLRYSVCVLWVGVMMLSMAQGKSNRYAFPLLASLLNISLLFGGYCLTPRVFKNLCRLLKVTSFLVVVGSLIFFSIKPLPGVNAFQWVICLGSAILAALFVILSTYHKMWKYYPVYIGLVFLVVRLCQGEIYSSFRNETRSVKPLARGITDALGGRTLYTLEVFERWTLFYAKILGLKAYRLSPEMELENLKSPDSSSFLLLDYEEESWRYSQALIYSEKVELPRVFAHSTSSAYLLEVPNSILPKFKVLSEFPTHPSIPFYPELDARGLLK
jgi:4-amino-4-deoxy-L-arabinose transferase-like glycosyltransferase